MDNKSRVKISQKRKSSMCKCILENGKKCKKKLSAVDLCIVCKCGKHS